MCAGALTDVYVHCFPKLKRGLKTCLLCITYMAISIEEILDSSGLQKFSK